MKFVRTQEAASQDKKSRWDLVAAIAEDAIDAGIPISSADSMLATQKAASAVGLELSGSTVSHLAVLAKFDHESTDRQRQEWRRYGTSVVKEVVLAGWSQEAAFDLLSKPQRMTQAQVRHAVKSASNVVNDVGTSDLNASLHSALNELSRWFRTVAALSERADAEDVELDAHASMCILMYQRMAEKRIDAELRQLFEEEAAK